MERRKYRVIKTEQDLINSKIGEPVRIAGGGIGYVNYILDNLLTTLWEHKTSNGKKEITQTRYSLHRKKSIEENFWVNPRDVILKIVKREVLATVKESSNIYGFYKKMLERNIREYKRLISKLEEVA